MKTPSQLPFSDLMRLLKLKDEGAIEYVFHQYTDRLIRLAAKRLPAMLKSKVDAEDVVQSAMRSFFERNAEGHYEFSDWNSLWAMLTVITIRKCGHQSERFRSAKRDVHRECSIERDKETSRWELSDDADSPVDSMILEETLKEVLHDFKPHEQSIVVLRLQGYTVNEISQKISRSTRTVERTLSAVRTSLMRLRMNAVRSC